jgi:hypothetical protein
MQNLCFRLEIILALSVLFLFAPGLGIIALAIVCFCCKPNAHSSETEQIYSIFCGSCLLAMGAIWAIL